MNKRIKIFTVASLLLLSVVAQAQFRFGPQGGVNLTTAKTVDLAEGDVKGKTGINIGAIAEYRFSSGFGFQTGLIYGQKGFKTTSDIFGDVTVSPIYLDVPLYLKYTFDFENFKLFGLGGTYAAYGIGGKIKSPSYNETTGVLTTETADIKYGNATDSDLTRMDFGVNLGAGVEFKNFMLTAQYGLGLKNVISEPTGNEEMKNRNFSISLAYLFGGK